MSVVRICTSMHQMRILFKPYRSLGWGTESQRGPPGGDRELEAHATVGWHLDGSESFPERSLEAGTSDAKSRCQVLARISHHGRRRAGLMVFRKLACKSSDGD
jgi:hypothetical protein